MKQGHNIRYCLARTYFQPLFLGGGLHARKMTAVEAQRTSYVGQMVPLASEYHENDFKWHEHAEACSHIVRRQEEMAAAAACATSRGEDRLRGPASTHPDHAASVSQACHHTPTTRRSRAATAEEGGRQNSGQSIAPVSRSTDWDDRGQELPMNSASEDETNHWETFYRQHAEARFYKLRRYILKVKPRSATASLGTVATRRGTEV